MTQPDPGRKPEDIPLESPMPRSPARTNGELQPANEAESPPEEPKNEET
jgi:hypothetical protein